MLDCQAASASLCAEVRARMNQINQTQSDVEPGTIYTSQSRSEGLPQEGACPQLGKIPNILSKWPFKIFFYASMFCLLFQVLPHLARVSWERQKFSFWNLDPSFHHGSCDWPGCSSKIRMCANTHQILWDFKSVETSNKTVTKWAGEGQDRKGRNENIAATSLGPTLEKWSTYSLPH